jgi:hypothetical protein
MRRRLQRHGVVTHMPPACCCRAPPHHTTPHPPAEGEAYDISLNKLNSLLEARTKYYENADVVIDLKGYGKDEEAGAPAAGVC